MLGAARAGATRQPSSCLPMPGTYASTLPESIDGADSPLCRKPRSYGAEGENVGQAQPQTHSRVYSISNQSTHSRVIRRQTTTRDAPARLNRALARAKRTHKNGLCLNLPTPGPQATYDCPWSPKRQGKDKPCMTDAQCNGAWLGPGAHMCSKCHNSVVGARAICGPK